MLALLQVTAALFAQSSGSTNYVLPSLIGIIIGGGVGAAIGSSKNRMGLGLVLGALLGCIGWIIIAVIPRKQTY